MSSYSHRGYEHRTGSYGRRRHKASGFRSKNRGGGVLKVTVTVVTVFAAAALVYLFADNIIPFINYFDRTPAIDTADTPTNSEISVVETVEEPTANGYFDPVDSKIFVSDGCGYTIFKGIDTTARYYSAVLNSIASSISGNINIYNAVIPTNTELGLSLPVKGSHSQSENLDVIRSALSDRVTSIDLYSALLQHKSEYIYFHTDELMTSLGGYYCYKQIAHSAAFDEKRVYSRAVLSEKSGVIDPFKGSYITRTTDAHTQPLGNPILSSNSDKIEYYKIPVNYNCFAFDKNGSRTETDLFSEKGIGDDPLKIFPAKDIPLMTVEIPQTSETGRLLIVKDHAAEPVIGYLIPHFKEVHIIDVTLYSGDFSEYVNSHEITDILFINGIDDANNSLYCRRLRDKFDNSISN